MKSLFTHQYNYFSIKHLRKKKKIKKNAIYNLRNTQVNMQEKYTAFIFLLRKISKNKNLKKDSNKTILVTIV